MTTSGITVFGQPSQPNHGAGGRIAMDDAVFPTDYVALDLETTGFYPNSCAITEIGAVRVREGHIVDQFQQLVNPLRPIPRQITTLTGITDAMVADLDPIDEVLPDSSHGSLPRLPVPPSSRLSAITSASICDSWITTPGISPAAALPARIMTRCRSAAPCSRAAASPSGRPDRTLRHRGQ